MTIGFDTNFEIITDIYFVVKNISLQQKRVAVFGLSIPYNGIANLLALPEVSEADIRHSLIKGELASKLRNKDIIVTNSNIDLLQFSTEQKQFLQDHGVYIGIEISSDNVFTGAPVNIGTVNLEGISLNISRADHIHNHGNQTNGDLHATVIANSTAGFMSGSDKAKLDRIDGYLSLLSPVTLLSDLDNINTSSLDDGTFIYVNELEDFYILEKQNTHTVDGLCVVAATDGYWVAKQVGRWDDIQGPVEQGTGVSALTKEVWRDTPFQMYWLRHDQNDELNFTYQTSHQWKYNTAVRPHIHIMIGSNPSVTQYIFIDGYYAWSRPDNINALPAKNGWTYFTGSFPVNPGDINTQKILSLGNITPPSWARESTSILIYFRRFGTSPSDTFNTNKAYGTLAANVAILTTDLHYQKINLGSEKEIP